MLLEHIIKNSINKFGVIPKDNMDGTYSFGRVPTRKNSIQGWPYTRYIIVCCDVCGEACVKVNSMQYKEVRCSPECNNMKAFTYEECKKGFHKKKMPKGNGEKKGLTAKQRNLPPALQKAIAAKKKK